MNSSGGFWYMGGYARYVWPCVGFACVVLIWNLWSALRYLAAAKVRAARALTMADSEMAASEAP